ncbi:MAG: hypothetical protein KC619_02850 [Myxococcales bacterium]|nr:hypothetical protein [Myxococcales bacterium]
MLALGALALIGAGFYVWWSGATRPSQSTEPPRVVEGQGLGGGGGGAEPGGDVEPGGATSSNGRRRIVGDGGVPQVALHVDPSEPTAGRTNDNGLPTSRGIPREDPGANESAGWRLGQARRRIAILEERVQVYQGLVDRFIAEGNTETAERQRAVLDRVQRRVTEFREQEQQLVREAETEGTMGDVDRGYEEGEAEARPPVQGGTAGTR